MNWSRVLRCADLAYRVRAFPSWFPVLLVWSAFWPLCLYVYSEHLSICRSLTLFLCSLQDYWLSLLYKRLIGPKVLAVHVAGLQRKPRPGRVIRDKLRIYAHCTNHHKSVFRETAQRPPLRIFRPVWELCTTLDPFRTLKTASDFTRPTLCKFQMISDKQFFLQVKPLSHT